MKNAFFTPEGFYRTAGYSVKWLYGLGGRLRRRRVLPRLFCLPH